jgi:hypothetical protein
VRLVSYRYTITRERAGEMVPSFEGLCAVHPDRQRIALFEVDRDGNVTEGLITATESRVTSEEVIYGAAGSALPVGVELVRTAADAFAIEALVERDGRWASVFEAAYTRE